MYFDIHSHILPNIDDGAKNIETAIKLLEMSKENGITHILATPHFYPDSDSLDEFLSKTQGLYEKLNNEITNLQLPKVYLGCEILYFIGIGQADNLEKLTLNGSKYILIELDFRDMNSFLFEDLEKLADRGFIPIIAHAERYHKGRGFRKMLRFAKKNKMPIQINAASILSKHYKRVIKGILRSGAFCVIATDAHSIKNRPPLSKTALEEVKKSFGEKYYRILNNNAQTLYKNIIGEDIEKR